MWKSSKLKALGRACGIICRTPREHENVGSLVEIIMNFEAAVAEYDTARWAFGSAGPMQAQVA